MRRVVRLLCVSALAWTFSQAQPARADRAALASLVGNLPSIKTEILGLVGGAFIAAGAWRQRTARRRRGRA